MYKELKIEPGVIVYAQGREYIITHIIDLESVLAKGTDTGDNARLRIEEITSKPSSPNDEDRITKNANDPLLITVPDKDWQEANRRYDLLRPLLTDGKRTTEMVEKVAADAGVHMVTIYRWIGMFERTGRVSSLIPTDKNGGRGQTRLSSEVEKIVKSTIENYYLSDQKRSISGTIREIERLCRNADLQTPHGNTIRNRIATLSDKTKTYNRHGRQAAHQKFSPVVGHFPGADYPLSVVQIDHTELDIIVVDEVNRLAVGRPWITVAIDTFSRMVLGFYIGLEKPSAMSVGICLSNAILSKEKFLAQMGIEIPWHCWGLPAVVHADNAREFRGAMLKRVCQEYGVDLVWRPVGSPHYGSHIERMMGNFAQELHDLPGTTQSNPQKRGKYDSEKNAAFTLPELEKWLTLYITGVYHQKFRKSLMMSPVKKYEEGLLGTQTKKGRGLPPKINDEEKLRLDFMPHFERTIQRGYGVEIDVITYYSDVLQEFIGAEDPEHQGLSQKFIFKRDPRNIREIYFYHPNLKRYYSIPYRNITNPPMSIWELREVRRRLEEAGRGDIDENLIFQTYNNLRAEEEKAVRETKQVRRKRQKRTYHSKVQYKTNGNLPSS